MKVDEDKTDAGFIKHLMGPHTIRLQEENAVQLNELRKRFLFPIERGVKHRLLRLVIAIAYIRTREPLCNYCDTPLTQVGPGLFSCVKCNTPEDGDEVD